MIWDISGTWPYYNIPIKYARTRPWLIRFLQCWQPVQFGLVRFGSVPESQAQPQPRSRNTLKLLNIDYLSILFRSDFGREFGMEGPKMAQMQITCENAISPLLFLPLVTVAATQFDISFSDAGKKGSPRLTACEMREWINSRGINAAENIVRGSQIKAFCLKNSQSCNCIRQNRVICQLSVGQLTYLFSCTATLSSKFQGFRSVTGSHWQTSLSGN